MEDSLIQFEIEESEKIRAGIICKKLGIDLPTYMKMCISRLVYENGIPIGMNLSE